MLNNYIKNNIIIYYCNECFNNYIGYNNTCPFCNIKQKFDIYDFISKSIKIHMNKYDYNDSKYINSTTKIKIFCSSCKKYFYQLPSNHLKGKGCANCSKNKKIKFHEFCSKSKLKHNNKYTYKECDSYTNLHSKIEITCDCGNIFIQFAYAHLRGQGCKFCSGNNCKNTEDYVEMCKLAHLDQYNYSKFVYKNRDIKSIIICNKCNNEFLQQPYKHLINKQGCPICNFSKGELSIKNYLDINGIKYSYQYYLNNMVFDFKINDKLYIEYDGIQHFEFVKYFHKNQEGFEKQLERDKRKTEYCLENNIGLLRIKYDDNIEEKLKEILS